MRAEQGATATPEVRGGGAGGGHGTGRSTGEFGEARGAAVSFVRVWMSVRLQPRTR